MRGSRKFFTQTEDASLFISIVTILTLYIISIDVIVSRRTVIILGLVLLTIDIIIINLYDDMLDKYATEQENNMLREQMKIYENQQRISMSEIRELTRLLRICSNNLNQYAKCANESGNVYTADMEDLQGRFDGLRDAVNSLLQEFANIP